MSPVAASVDEFLAKVPPDKRAALEELRKVIREAAPEATEVINYGVPMFRLNGNNLVSYAAAKDHCSFYVQSPARSPSTTPPSTSMSCWASACWPGSWRRTTFRSPR